MKTKLLRTVFLLWFLAPALYVFSLSAKPLYKGFSSSRWPSVEGKIASTAIISDLTKGGPTRFGAPPSYRDISYTYTVEGHSYTSHRVAFVRLFEKSDSSARFQEGMTIPVYYHPQDPTLSTLTVMTTRDFLAGMILPIICLGFVLLCLVLLAKTWLRSGSPTEAGIDLRN